MIDFHVGDVISTRTELEELPVGTLLSDVTCDPLVRVADGFATWDPDADRGSFGFGRWLILDLDEVLGNYGPEGSSPFLPARVDHLP